MINKPLFELASELNWYSSGDSIFGIFNGQYIKVEYTQYVYFFSFRIVETKKELISNHFKSQTHLKYKNEQLKFTVQQDHLSLINVRHPFLGKGAKEKIKSIIENVATELSMYQKWNQDPSVEIILVNGVPGPKDSSFIANIENTINEMNKKPFDHSQMVKTIFLSSILTGLLLGVISAFGTLYADQDFIPIGKGLLALSLMLILYIKRESRLRPNEVWIIGLGSLVLMLFWDLSLIFNLLKLEKKESHISLIFEIYRSHLLKMTVFGKASIANFLTVIISSFILYFKTNKKMVIQEGIRSDSIKLTKEIAQYSNVHHWVGTGLILFLILNCIPLLRTSYHSSVTGTIILLHICIFIFLSTVMYILMKKSIRLKSAFDFNGYKKIGPKRRKILLICYIYIASMGIAFFYYSLNVILDSSSNVKINARIIEDFTRASSDNCSGASFKLIENSEEIDYGVCSSRYDFITQDMNVYLVKREGFFKLSYFDGILVSDLESISSFISIHKSDEELRSKHVQYFAKVENPKIFSQFQKSWEQKCISYKNYNCRLASYIFENSDPRKASGFLEMACNANC
ncbi:MAG TPA: hypothetical protein VNJ01_18305 [Bacteriovoracaceae bacterium]|nr:hypothetical protein [Bacteriovoracaceae bacterium]